ncbi:MAG TPA: DUF4861 family protein, partial [Gemmatimonadaceae bacterium]|nr:DUF4861 family protein [Gemmatimonadaceae bacterium]
MSTTIARGAWCAALLVPSVALAQLERVTSGESRAVTARNPLPIERRDETIALPWSAVAGLRGAEPGRVRVADAAGREVLSQLLDVNADGQPDSLLFQASFGPNETRSFQLQATAPATRVASRVAVRHDDPRDDMAWENDLVAFRIYGEGLKKTPSAMSSNGIDIWLKRTRDLIVEKWYAKGHDAYHIDTGEGADFFDVGTTLGVGGTALWRGDSLQRADNFKAWKVIATGPIRAVFELRYDPWGDAGLRVTEVKRVSIDAGQQLYRVESTFQPVGSSAATLPLATGVVKRPGMVGIMNRERPWAWVTGWGPVARKNGGHGELGTAVLVPRDRLVDWKETGNHYLAVTRAAAGQPWVQYNGFAWTAAGDV